MAETFIVGFGRIELKPDSGISHLFEESGLLVTGRNRDATWRGRLTTGKLEQAEYAQLFAQLTDAIERNLRFDFVHPRFVAPRPYTIATWPLAEDCELVAVTDLYTLSVAGLTEGLVLPRGTRLTLKQGEGASERVGYRMLRSDVTVASDTAQALAITPRLPMGVFAAEAAVIFKNPPVRLAIVPGTLDMTEEYQPTPVSFEVSEALA